VKLQRHGRRALARAVSRLLSALTLRPGAPAAMTPAAMTPAAVTPAAMTPAAVTPARSRVDRAASFT